MLGRLYADIEGAFGRFRDADQDLMAMVAGQAAVALANLRARPAGALEPRWQAEARRCEQRAAELAIVNACSRRWRPS